MTPIFCAVCCEWYCTIRESSQTSPQASSYVAAAAQCYMVLDMSRFWKCCPLWATLLSTPFIGSSLFTGKFQSSDQEDMHSPEQLSLVRCVVSAGSKAVQGCSVCLALVACTVENEGFLSLHLSPPPLPNPHDQWAQHIPACFEVLHGDPAVFYPTGSSQGLVDWVTGSQGYLYLLICICWCTPLIAGTLSLPSGMRQWNSLFTNGSFSPLAYSHCPQVLYQDPCSCSCSSAFAGMSHVVWVIICI